ncbi:hypothetical protein WHR41_00629 [Cladosporium halotolerans]|uniref:Inheritance of peroxisomes protein 1 n=1 Tax=Cladosporium halotolerans TaxID=1052096 RepID=A0AB34L2E2_9PEZI
MTRSFTVPPRLTVATRADPTPEIGAADGIETLYVHPSASIIKFNTGGSRPGSSSGLSRSRNTDNTGTLPWSYPTETTVAAGPMEIYRVPGSVSFLHSGALLHAILPRSQCWCVDGVSKFAFRVLPETYYRIELPGETAEDMELVEALKVTLKKVLFYERTACPFARGFTVELPAEEVKIKKRNSVREGPAKKWKLQKAYDWKPEGWEEEEMQRKMRQAEAQSSGENSQSSGEEEDAPSKGDTPTGEEEDNDTETPSRARPRALESMRSVTAPPELQVKSTPPSRVRSRVEAVETVDRAHKAERVRFSAEVNRRSSIQASRVSSIPVDLPPSPPDSSAGAENQMLDEISGSDEELEDETDDARTAQSPVISVSPAQGDNIPAWVQTPGDTNLSSDGRDSHLSSDNALEDDSTQEDHEPQQTPTASPKDEKHVVLEEVPAPNEDELARQFGDTNLSGNCQSQDFTEQDKASGKQMKANLIAEQPGIMQKPATSARGTALEDPYAAIQARIQARRSIGGTTTSFEPSTNAPTRKSTASTSTSATIASRRSQKTDVALRQQSITAALVNKACAVFLGPPAHLVTMMLRIAARFSRGAFGTNGMFFVESPIGSPRRVPGSFYVEDEEDLAWKSDEDDWEEDDFGVPLKSPVRISGVRERARREGWEME